MAYHSIKAAQVQEDGSGVTIAVALVLRLHGSIPSTIDVERWVHDIEDKILGVFGGDEKTPVGIAIRATERSDKQTTANLILDAAVECSRQFELSRDSRPIRTAANFGTPGGSVTN